jgi:hypothetical protein
MTIKPKTRKAAAAKRAASKSAMVKTDGESKSVISGICKLIACWRWLEADRAYIYAITKPEKEADRLVMSHQKEQRDIEVRLSKLVPKNLWQVMHLLEFATEMVEQGGSDDLEVKMLKNAKEGVRLVWSRTECEADRIKFLAAQAVQAAL